MPDDDTPTREQLVEARKGIIAQLDELNFRATAKGFARRGGGPPDYSGLIAEFQEQLQEIDDILNAGLFPGHNS